MKELFRIEPFIIAHVTSFIIISIAVVVANIIKNKQETKQTYVANNTATVGIAEYVFIFVMGIVGAFVYYSIH